jgi:hypothetical protein
MAYTQCQQNRCIKEQLKEWEFLHVLLRKLTETDTYARRDRSSPFTGKKHHCLVKFVCYDDLNTAVIGKNNDFCTLMECHLCSAYE